MLTIPNQYCPLTPTEKQQAFLALPGLEAFFGGAAGGGKSIALLMGALEYVDQPGYAALILRKDTQRLALAGGLIPRSHEWLTGKGPRWNEARRTWTFPCPGGGHATLTFGYLARPDDKYRYLSSEFQYIAFDELTELTQEDYLYLFSRLRKSKTLAHVSLRIRSASNPGNVGHLWVKQRFVSQASGRREPPDGADSPLHPRRNGQRVFLPSRLADNPFLDAAEYRRSLQHLDPLTRERLLNGDWDVQEQGLIRPEWLRYYVEVPRGELQSPDQWSGCYSSPPSPLPGAISSAKSPRPLVGALTLDLLAADSRSLAQVSPANCRRFITVDPAGTSADRAREDRGRPPSYTVAQIWDQPRCELSRFLILRHQIRGLFGFDEIVAMLDALCTDWRPEQIWIENEKLGQAAYDQLHRKLPMALVPTRGKDKAARASLLLLKFSRGEIYLPKHENSWLPVFEAELLAWTGRDNQPTDQIDAAAYAAIVSQTAAPGILVMEHIAHE
jgi:hypothetical protein